jgi:hypothetical protein
MPESLDSMHPCLPVSNYGPAVARALEWLGDRYLLAQPINAITQGRGAARKAAKLAAGEYVSGEARQFLPMDFPT